MIVMLLLVTVIFHLIPGAVTASKYNTLSLA
jgi:hypothetical protein